MLTARIEELEREHIPKHFSGDQGYARPVCLSIERTRHYTESWKETEGEPMSIRRAKALAHHLDNMGISIRPNELIVGNYADDPHVLAFGVETSESSWAKDLIDSLGKEEEKKEWYELLDYWDRHNLASMIKPLLTDKEWELAHSFQRYVECLPTQMTTRTMPDHELYLTLGVNKIIEMIHEKLDRRYREKDKCTQGKEATEIALKINDLKAMLIAAEAFLRWTNRYALLAKDMAEEEQDPRRKAELLEISEICSWVPGNPARNFREALQSHWFAFLCYQETEIMCHGVSMRLDQVFWPCYEKDVIIDKTLPREEALELMENFLLHIDEMGRPLPLDFRREMQGINYIGVYTIGGVKPEDGSDACNELTMVILDALDDLKLSHPDFKFRWHPKADPRAWRRTVEIIRSGLGQPSIKNDQVAIDILMNHYGFTLEEARSYAIVGCISPAPSLNWGRCRRDAFSLRPAKALELALNNGFDPVTSGSGALGQVGPRTGNAEEFISFDQVFEAFRAQMAFFIQKAMHIKALSEHAYNTLCKRPFASCFYHRSLESERDIVDTPEKGMPWFNAPGVVDSADSLTGLKKLVFDDKKYSLKEVLAALRADWEGYEAMRQDFINVPKFGNDDDYADEIAKRTYAMLAEEAAKVTDVNGASPMPSGLVVTAMYLLAPLTGALPNGRKLGDPLADGGCSPYAGYDKNGPMAAVLSASKIDQRRWKASVFNQKLTPGSIAGESGLRKFQSYIEAALGLGLEMIQFNVVDAATLRDAQRHPEKYPYLTVRVSGYNARFVELHEFVQNSIIERTEHTLGG